MPRTYTRTCTCNRCQRCRNRERRRLQRRMQKAGTWQPWHPNPEQVREHINHLRDHGVGLDAIAESAGIARISVQRITYGTYKYVTTETAEAILAVTPRAAKQVNPTGTRRRLQALATLGYSYPYLSEKLGVNPRGVAAYAAPSKRWVMRDTAEKVRQLYDELSMKPGPDQTAALRAKNKGWAPPLAWDDDTIDDPNALPKFGHRPKGYASNLPDIDILVAEVNRSGLHVVADKYGVAPGSVGIHLNRNGYHAAHHGDKHGELSTYRKAS